MSKCQKKYSTDQIKPTQSKISNAGHINQKDSPHWGTATVPRKEICSACCSDVHWDSGRVQRMGRTREHSSEYLTARPRAHRMATDLALQ